MPAAPATLPVRDGAAIAALHDTSPSSAAVPTVFTGLQDTWLARERWTPTRLAEHHGHLPVAERRYAPGDAYEYTIADTTLGDYLAHWSSTDPDPALTRTRRYLAEWNFARDAPGLLDDFAVPAPFAEDWIDRLPEQVRFGRMWLFFGEPGCHTGLHRDTFSTSAWLAVLSGHKVLRFVSPEATGALRPGDSLWDADALARVDAAPGGQTHEVVLRAGETLYIPGDWYHEVRNPVRNLMVTANFVEQHKVLTFLAQFEARLSEPLEVLREARNAHVRDGAAELADPAFRAKQLSWVRDRTAQLRAYEEALVAGEPGRVAC